MLLPFLVLAQYNKLILSFLGVWFLCYFIYEIGHYYYVCSLFSHGVDSYNYFVPAKLQYHALFVLNMPDSIVHPFSSGLVIDWDYLHHIFFNSKETILKAILWRGLILLFPRLWNIFISCKITLKDEMKYLVVRLWKCQCIFYVYLIWFVYFGHVRDDVGVADGFVILKIR